MAKLLYQGHGSYRITSDNGKVIYVDPFAGEGYNVPADIVLVTHQHRDHNRVNLVVRTPECRVITNKEALDESGRHNSFLIDDISVEAVEAKNFMHSSKKCVGYIITVDGIKIYALGDTSKTEQMKTFSARSLDYALFPCDGLANMRMKEAMQCAEIIGAKHNIPIHLKLGKIFDKKRAEKFKAPNRLIVEPGQEVML